MNFAWRKWKLGVLVSVVLALLVAGSGVAAGMHWQAFVSVLCMALLTHLGAFLKDHPVDAVSFDDSNQNDSMKKIVPLLLLTILTATAALCLLSGCASAPGATSATDTPAAGLTPPAGHVPNVAAMSSIAQSAVYLGTTVYLNGLAPSVPAHPADRPAFETARTGLRTLIAAGTFSAADLTAALQALPIGELKGSTGTLIVGETVILWDQYGQQLASLDKAQVFNTYILPVAKAILAGLDMALGPAPTPLAQ